MLKQVQYLLSRNRIGGGSGAAEAAASQTRSKSPSPTKVTDIRQLLEEKRHGQQRQPPAERSAAAKKGVKVEQQPLAAAAADNDDAQLAPLLFADVRQRLGKRRYSPDRGLSPSPSPTREAAPVREPSRGVHRRLGVASQDRRGFYSSSSKDRKKSKSVCLMISPGGINTVFWV